MKILIFQTGEPIHIDKESRPMRAINLVNKFLEKNHKVILITARFDHYNKTHRKQNNLIKVNDNYQIRLLNSPGYKNTIGLLRVIDHCYLAANLFLKLITKEIPTPDVCIVGYPPIESAFILIHWFRFKKVLTILDVKDLWPEIFSSRFPKKLNWFINFCTLPYKFLAINTINRANIVTSISDPYLKWTQDYSKRKKNNFDLTLPLAGPKITLNKFEEKETLNWWKKRGIKFNKNTFCFIGSLSIAYEFKFLANAIKLLEKNGEEFQFIICGKGNNEERIKSWFSDSNSVFFPGWIDTRKAHVLRKNSIATLVPLINSEDFVKSIPNKIIDSFAYDLPIITSLDGYLKKLIEDNKCGLFVENNSESWYKAIFCIMDSKDLRIKLSKNCKSYASKRYDFDSIFNNFVSKVERITKEVYY